jgi:hypothetical protein
VLPAATTPPWQQTVVLESTPIANLAYELTGITDRPAYQTDPTPIFPPTGEASKAAQIPCLRITVDMTRIREDPAGQLPGATPPSGSADDSAPDHSAVVRLSAGGSAWPEFYDTRSRSASRASSAPCRGGESGPKQRSAITSRSACRGQGDFKVV